MSIRTGARQNRIRLNRIEKTERQTLQAESKRAVEQLADEAVERPAARPTDTTRADARAAIQYDPRTQQLMSNLQGDLPSADVEDGTLTITGTERDDEIRIDHDGDTIHAYGNDADGEQQLLGSWEADDVDRIEVAGGDGDDTIVNDGEGTRDANIDGGTGDDIIVNTQGGATITGGAGENQIFNSGDDVAIGSGEDVDSSDFVFNAGDDVNIQYQNAGAHQLQSLGNDGQIASAGENGSVNVVGDGNGVELSGRGNEVTVQGDGNAVVGTTGGNSVEVAGDGNGVDLVGTGNSVDLNGDGNVFVGDNAAGMLLDNFDALDADGDGFLLPEEIGQLQGAEGIADAADSLIFGNIDEGSTAWHGLSRDDLEVVANRMYGGETLDEIAEDLRTNSWLGQRLAENGTEVTAESFSEAAEQYRMSNPRPEVDPSALNPLNDPNAVTLTGNFNAIATPGPNTWAQFVGTGNQINVGASSTVFGLGDLNQINLAGPGSALAFGGRGNAIAGGPGSAILGVGDFNTISGDEVQVAVLGNNVVNGQLQLDPQLMQVLQTYFAMMLDPNGLPTSEG